MLGFLESMGVLLFNIIIAIQKHVTRELGKQWREMSDEDKNPYVKMAKENEEEYKR